MTTATQQGAANNNATPVHSTGSDKLTLGMEWSETDAEEELLERFLKTIPDAEKPSAQKEEKDKRTPEPKDKDKSSAEKPEDETDDEDEEETDQDGDDDEDNEDGDKEKKYAEDGAYVKYTVDGEQFEISTKDIARLAGQEKALTKKSMEVADLRKFADTETQKNTLATQALLARAEERWKPFAGLDFNLLATQLQPDEYTALRDAAKTAWDEKEFLSSHLDAFATAVQQREMSTLQTKAKECLTVLSGPADKGGIEGWSQKLYDEIRAFGASYGIPVENINKAVDPWAIRLMHDAMLYARGRNKGEVKVTKVKKGPKKITKTTNAAERDGGSSGNNASKIKKTMAKLQSTGDTDDAAQALLARWEKDSDD